MGKFDGILICTDLDGTLLRDDKSISRENLDAVEHFKREGGYFTFVTGRMPFFVSDIYNAVRPNAPIGCINGGGLYDFTRGDYIWRAELSTEAMELVRAVDTAVPGVGIQVNCFYKTYFSKENETMVRFRAVTGLPNLVCHYDEVPEPVAKIIFGSEDEAELLRVAELLRAHPLADRFDFIRSEHTLFEILPKGVGKGTSVTRLAEHLGLDRRRTVAVGDYDNDVSMLTAAGLGVAVANASPAAIAAADAVTVSNGEHAIAKVISDIESGAYAF